MKKIKFTDEQIQDIIKKYSKENLSLSTIGEIYGVSRTVITRIIKENNVAIKKTHHKYFADYRKFQIIDSPEKAYWLGFIAADGCNYWREQNASLVINIHQRDIEHLEKFKNFMNSNVNIDTFIQDAGFSNNTPMCKIVFNSKELSKDLSDKGIIPKKSLILKPPKIDEQYYLPFILGYFDGDGSICYIKSSRHYEISFTGTFEIINWIRDVLKVDFSFGQRHPNEDINNCYIKCGGTKKPYFIMKKLYDSCNTHLDRKYEKFKALETVVLNRNVK
jgi:hypothetical protein